MNKQTEAKIRERAYALWEDAGKIDGREVDFWLQAEQEIQKTEKPAARKRAAPKAKPKAGKAKTEKTAAPKKAAAKAKPAAKTTKKAAPKAGPKPTMH